MKRKGWHRKKRRLRHDHWEQMKRTLYNHYVREWERSLVSQQEYYEILMRAMGGVPRGMLDVLGTPKP